MLTAILFTLWIALNGGLYRIVPEFRPFAVQTFIFGAGWLGMLWLVTSAIAVG